MLNWLRKFGTIGETLAWILTLIQTQLTWGAVVSLALAIAAAIWSRLFDFFNDKHTQIAIGVFLAALWTYIGIVVLRGRKTPQIVKFAHDYAYGLILDGGWQPTFGKFPKDHPSSPDGDAITITCNYRNVSQGPLRMKIEDFRVVLNHRTNDDPNSPPDEMIFARETLQKSLNDPILC